MKIILKALVALITVMVGGILGIALLSGYIWWKVLLFLSACYLIGHLIYGLLRVIDKNFSS